MKAISRVLFCTLISCLYVSSSFALPIVFKGGRLLIGERVEILKDDSGKYSATEAYLSKDFYINGPGIPNFDLSDATYWIKFSLRNTIHEQLFLEIENPLIDTCDLYIIKNNRAYLSSKSGSAQDFNLRKYKYPDMVFGLNIPADSTITYLLKVRSSEQLLLPMIIGSSQATIEAQNTKDVISGIHFGVLAVMFFYNLFIFLSTKDRSYLFYVLYIFFICLTQITLTGYSFKYLFPGSPGLFNYTIVIAAALAGISASYFIRSFLHTKSLTPFLDKVLRWIAVLYGLAACLRIAGFDQLSSRAIDIIALSIACVAYVVAIKLSLKNYRPAKFFLLAWTIFIIGLVLFVLRNLNILPYSSFTSYTMQLGTVLEVTLLSIALADKINIFRKEKERSQHETVLALQENERIIREQNIMLEKKVNERTFELNESNSELSRTLDDLKQAQIQLVESEKMASLGQLTAGIAHEINNPINFVTSNVAPLQRDVNLLMEAVETIQGVGLTDVPTAEKQKQIDDYREEIDYDYLKVEINHLLKGINEGASRTAEIVRGLRVFSRLDEDDLKLANINEGLESTMVIVNNLLGDKITVVTEYGDLPLIECYPGKLNQVFLNIISNGIHAIKQRYGQEDTGKLLIKTYSTASQVFIAISDNGTGMDENTMKKIFEPFFTTKDVGEGTGLGMSIAYNTVKKHNGIINVESTIGEGSKFTIELPISMNVGKNP